MAVRTRRGVVDLRLVEQQHTKQLAYRVRYSTLPGGHIPGQLAPPGTGTTDEVSA